MDSKSFALEAINKEAVDLVCGPSQLNFVGVVMNLMFLSCPSFVLGIH